MSESDKWFDIRKVVDLGTAVLFVGRPHTGKTTMCKELISYIQEHGIGDGDIYRGQQLPFPIIVHAPMSSILEYKDVKGIHKTAVVPTPKRFEYIASRYRNSFVIIEDITMWLKGANYRYIRDVFARHRKKSYNCALLATADSLGSVGDFIDAFSHIFFFGKSHPIKPIKELLPPQCVKDILNAIDKMQTDFDYVIFDFKRWTVTEPLYGDVIPVCYAFYDAIEKVSVQPREFVKEVVTPKFDDYVPKRPIEVFLSRTTKDLIISTLKEAPWLSSRAIVVLIEKMTGRTVSEAYVRFVRCKFGIRRASFPEDIVKYVRQFLISEGVLPKPPNNSVGGGR
jgi:hypothetical protein